MSFAYYRWFPGDYARDTGHLTMLQHGAYRQLIDTYMGTGKPVRGDLHALHRICGALSGEERQAVEFVLAEFFVQDGPVWRHTRCDRELNYLNDLSECGRNAAAMRWQSERNAKAMPTRTRTRTRKRQTPSVANAKIAFATEGGWLNVSDRDRKAWSAAYPALDIDAELAKAWAWADANPKKQQWKRFLTGWFGREQKRASTVTAKSYGKVI